MKTITLKKAYSLLAKAKFVSIDGEQEKQPPLLSRLFNEEDNRFLWLNSGESGTKWIKFYEKDNKAVELSADRKTLTMTGIQNQVSKKVNLTLLSASDARSL
jgi:hypothetical protein